MSSRWESIIYTAEKFWIIKEEEKYYEYIVMEKPVGIYGDGKPIEHYNAANDEEAIKKGLEIAKDHGLL